MLAADKLQLQSAIKQQATALKEKEFNLHHSNMMTIGTQAAVLAGLDITMFIEFNPPHNVEWGDSAYIARILKFFYYITILSAFCANILVVGQTSLLSIMGASLALRGPDGSMMVATDGMYDERSSIFIAFSYGLAATVASVVLCVWLFLSAEAAFVCMLITIYTCKIMYVKFKRIKKMFHFNESETVDFSDLFDGPGYVRIPSEPPTNTVDDLGVSTSTNSILSFGLKSLRNRNLKNSRNEQNENNIQHNGSIHNMELPNESEKLPILTV